MRLRGERSDWRNLERQVSAASQIAAQEFGVQILNLPQFFKCPMVCGSIFSVLDFHAYKCLTTFVLHHNGSKFRRKRRIQSVAEERELELHLKINFFKNLKKFFLNFFITVFATLKNFASPFSSIQLRWRWLL